MQKLISVKIKKNDIVCNFASELAAQTVPIVISKDDDIAGEIEAELEKLNLILLNLEGVVPASYLDSIGYSSNGLSIFVESETNKEQHVYFQQLVSRLSVTEFKLVENETVAKIAALRETFSNERFTKINYNAIDLYHGENPKLDQSDFAQEIVDIHERIQKMVQKVFICYSDNLAAEVDTLDIENELTAEIIYTKPNQNEA